MGQKMHSDRFYAMEKKFYSLLPDYDSDTQYKAQQWSIFNVFSGSPVILYNPANSNQKYDSYDINSAYPDALLKEQYPLPGKLEIQIINKPLNQFIPKYSHYIAYIEFKSKKVWYRFKDFEYNNFIFNKVLEFSNGVQYDPKTLSYKGWINEVDLQGARYFYDIDEMNITIKHVIYFTKFGSLVEYNPELSNFIKQEYNEIHSMVRGQARSERKRDFNTLTYGKLAQGHKVKDRLYTRNSLRCIIAAYQVSYVRLRMLKLVSKYYKEVVYIDTDSIKLIHGTVFDEVMGNELGQFKIEYINRRMLFFRFKGYVIFKENDQDIEETKFSRIPFQLTKEQVDDLIQKHKIEVLVPETNEEDSDLIIVTIEDIFYNYDSMKSYYIEKTTLIPNEVEDFLNSLEKEEVYV